MIPIAVWLASALAVVFSDDRLEWPQWGGPDRSFVVAARELADTWPTEGPRRLWQRPLGDGYSAIVTDGRTLYTLFRDGTADVAIALDAATGTTVWEARYEAPFVETCSERLGPVPRAAPLITGNRLIATSAGGMMTGFDRQTGRKLWSVTWSRRTPTAFAHAATPRARCPLATW